MYHVPCRVSDLLFIAFVSLSFPTGSVYFLDCDLFLLILLLYIILHPRSFSYSLDQTVCDATSFQVTTNFYALYTPFPEPLRLSLWFYWFATYTKRSFSKMQPVSTMLVFAKFFGSTQMLHIRIYFFVIFSFMRSEWETASFRYFVFKYIECQLARQSDEADKTNYM